MAQKVEGEGGGGVVVVYSLNNNNMYIQYKNSPIFVCLNSLASVCVTVFD